MRVYYDANEKITGSKLEIAPGAKPETIRISLTPQTRWDVQGYGIFQGKTIGIQLESEAIGRIVNIIRRGVGCYEELRSKRLLFGFKRFPQRDKELFRIEMTIDDADTITFYLTEGLANEVELYINYIRLSWFRQATLEQNKPKEFIPPAKIDKTVELILPEKEPSKPSLPITNQETPRKKVSEYTWDDIDLS